MHATKKRRFEPPRRNISEDAIPLRIAYTTAVDLSLRVVRCLERVGYGPEWISYRVLGVTGRWLPNEFSLSLSLHERKSWRHSTLYHNCKGVLHNALRQVTKGVLRSLYQATQKRRHAVTIRRSALLFKRSLDLITMWFRYFQNRPRY
jgi:hypothetical protein